MSNVTINLSSRYVNGQDIVPNTPGFPLAVQSAQIVVDGESRTSQVIPAGDTVTVPVLGLDPLVVKYIIIAVSEDGIHFEPDPVTTGNPSFSLFADTGFFWSYRMPAQMDHGFHEPVSSFVVHNPSANDAQLEIRIGYDNP